MLHADLNLPIPAKLREYSEVFDDMFGLPKVGSLNGVPIVEVDGRITLQDDPAEFAMLLDGVYGDL